MSIQGEIDMDKINPSESQNNSNYDESTPNQLVLRIKNVFKPIAKDDIFGQIENMVFWRSLLLTLNGSIFMIPLMFFCLYTLINSHEPG